MSTCPVCAMEIDSFKFDEHVGQCLAQLSAHKKPIKTNENSNRKKKNPTKLDLKGTKTENPNANGVQQQKEEGHSVANKRLKILKEAILNVKRALKNARDVICGSQTSFHSISEVGDIYAKFEEDIRLFTNNFSKFRNKIKLQCNEVMKENEEQPFGGHPKNNNLNGYADSLNGIQKHTQNKQNKIRQTKKTTSTNPFNVEPLSKCNICDNLLVKEGLVENDKCRHKACQFCVYKVFTENLSKKVYEREKLTCFLGVCDEELPFYKLNFLPKDQLELYSDQSVKCLTASDASFVSCPKCKVPFYKENGSWKPGEFANDRFEGVELSEEAQKDLVLNRFRCSNCRTEFCAHCESVPYHKGKTCRQHREYIHSEKCRFCKKVLEQDGKDEKGFCGNEECREKYSLACKKTLPCGHICIGVNGHEECFGCVKEGCSSKIEEASSDSLCQICWVDTFEESPCVQLHCKHIFHFKCLKTRLNKKWPSARISFGYLNCPLCKSKVQCDIPIIKSILEKERKFYLEIKEMAFRRINVEGFENDPKLTDKSSRYYGNPHEFALHKFAFYLCGKCGKPYFGGLRNCEEALQENSEEFNKEDLVCGACASGKNAKKCRVHGSEFITFKCKFCCNVANWFCWGKTHFCDSCHKKQLSGDYVTKKTKHKQCRGKESCPLKVDHPPNGTEFSLGCVVCLRK